MNRASETPRSNRDHGMTTNDEKFLGDIRDNWQADRARVAVQQLTNLEHSVFRLTHSRRG